MAARGKGKNTGKRKTTREKKGSEKLKEKEKISPTHRSYVAPLASARPSSCSNDPNSSSWIEQHAQPLASSIVSARSDVVLLLLLPFLFPPSPSSPSPPVPFSALLLFLCLDLSLRTSLASMLTSATSLTTQPILRWLEFCSRWRRTVVLPEKKTIF